MFEQFQGDWSLRNLSKTSSEVLRFWMLDLCRRFDWTLPSFSCFNMEFLSLVKQQWRTRIRWVPILVQQLPWYVTSMMTSLSLASSHQLFWGTPSTNCTRVSNSSWWTSISNVRSGSTTPFAGVTCGKIQVLFEIDSNYSMCKWSGKKISTL